MCVVRGPMRAIAWRIVCYIDMYVYICYRGTGTLFLAAGGTVLTKQLAPGEVLVVDTSSVVGFQSSVKFGVRLAGGCCTICCGGEGMFNSTLTGPGLVVVQSMSFEKYKLAVAPPVQSAGPPTPGADNA
jgi:uncharacterized protein (AIM24 family)